MAATVGSYCLNTTSWMHLQNRAGLDGLWRRQLCMILSLYGVGFRKRNSYIHLRMSFEKLTVAVSLIFCFVSPGKPCKRRSPIDVLEGEYFSNCCPAIEQDKGYTITWHREQEGKLMEIQEDNRIKMDGRYLQFWPVVLNDTGKYNCCLSNGSEVISCYEWSLNIIKRNKESCFNANHVLTVIPGIVGKSYFVKCNDIPHTANVSNITWYKNCERIVSQTEDEWYIEQLKAEDSGKYTCVKSLVHGGRTYNTTKTIDLIVKGDKELTIPALIGSDHSTSRAEIGKELLLNCTAFLGYSNKSDSFYWIHNDAIIDSCEDVEEQISLCQMKEHIYYEKRGKYVTRILWIKNVKEEDMNSSYNCILSFGGYPSICQIHTLLKDLSNPDLPVHVFTTGIIMAIFFSFAAVFMVILYVVFRFELVLLYREITGKDETLGDGKLYDAFVSYLKDSVPIYGEERKFALEVLPKILEDNFGYKLCIFERDISPGAAVIDDVQSFIDRSRRLIIILSKNYISDQVMFELEIGLHKALVERKIKVILIEYMPVTNFDFLPMSLQLLSSKQVVKWNKEKSLPLNSRFWKKLRYAMPAKPPLRKTLTTFEEQNHCRTEH
uniref:Interleukin 18 receptor 1 n=1 Tax=Anolis carolinensis TaxID=28377 RepID=A0A803SN52_ANOCA|nr:PREDICTED: interleukin-18 receptor 1 isoform X1 [Anolis carolinensis]|eukprot:XP_008114347.1 PREDICTED: interleukin-18 receptor 1 isoform X1 [Anolis carolinensis]